MANRLKKIKNSLVNKQKSRLSQVRQRFKLDGQQLRDLLFLPGNYDRYMKPIISFIEANKIIFTHHNIEEHNRYQQRKEAAKMIRSLLNFLKIDIQQNPLSFLYALYATAAFSQGISIKLLIQYILYTKTILVYQSNQKHKQFLNRAIIMQDIGCFGLTEYNHANYDKGIQTLAIYDPKNRQFVLTTQGTKGMKFWIGAAAESSNMSIIWAQLIVNQESHGPHPFVLQIRDRKTHQVLPGITIGDCGPKAGLNHLDNGYIILDNVRIPEDNLLGKFGSIDQNGKYYSKIGNPDVRFNLYMSTLSQGRGLQALSTNLASINALTIALRYACDRKQFDNPKKTDEILIIDYPLTKIRILPHLAKSIIQMFSGTLLGKAYVEDNQIVSNLQYTEQLFALTAAVITRVSENCTTAIGQSRSILGGHGYSSYSRISSSYHESDINNTGQADVNIILQQTSKYLMKTIAASQKTHLFDFSFVHKSYQFDIDRLQQDLSNVKTLQLLIQDFFRVKYLNAKKKIQELSQKYKDNGQVEEYFHSQAGYALSIAYADVYIFTVAKHKIESANSPQNKQFLTNLLYLWVFDLLEKERYGALQLRREIQKRILKLCDDLVDGSIVACDILAPSSYIIGSPFADYQGNGFKEYLNLIYSAKDTFRRPQYYEQIIQMREQQVKKR